MKEVPEVRRSTEGRRFEGTGCWSRSARGDLAATERRSALNSVASPTLSASPFSCFEKSSVESFGDSQRREPSESLSTSSQTIGVDLVRVLDRRGPYCKVGIVCRSKKT